MAKRHAVRCWLCDLRKAWQHIRTAKAARWTVGVHVIYYAHATATASGWHMVTAAACGLVLLLELLSKEK